MDKYVSKMDESGNMDSYFILEVYSGITKLSKLEKSYSEFENFKSELDFSLRGSNLIVPELTNGLFDSILPSNDSIFG